MKLGRLNHIGVATPSIADSIACSCDVMARNLHSLRQDITMSL